MTPNRVFSDASQPEVLFTDFDVAAYTNDALGRISVDPEAVRADPFDAVTAADLSFMWRLDSAGLSETRSILSAWTGNEARITAFIATWSYERMWLAWAIKDVLEAAGIRLEPRNRQRISARLREAWVDRLMPLTVPWMAAAIGEPFTAGHMIRMALQEASLRAAYAELLGRLAGEAHRVIAEIVERRATFVEFFHLEASARLARSRRERILARAALIGWEPLRIVGVPDPDEPRAMGNIFLSQEARSRLRAAQQPTRELLAGIGLVPGTDHSGGPAPPPTAGLLIRRKRHGV